jgi:hypothetical protein
MIPPVYKNEKFKLPLLKHPFPRVIKFKNILRYLNLVKTAGTVLDYGSGDRPYEEMLNSYFEHYLAADFSDSNRIHAKLPDIYINPDQTINISDSSVNCVFLTEVLEHIYKPAEALKEINRVLVKDGFLIGTVPFFQGEHEIPWDFFRYTYFALKKLFTEAGFEIVELEYVGDLIGVRISVYTRFCNLILRFFSKIKLNFVSYILNYLLKIPEAIYVFLWNHGVFPLNINYLKSFPLGFTFLLRKI